jgi:YD repeat-containing protein
MKSKQIVRLSLLSTLLVVLNGCGDGSNVEESKNDREVQLSNNSQTDANAPIITLKGDSQVNIIQGSSFEDVGATAVDREGKALDVMSVGSIDADKLGSYTIVYKATDSQSNESTLTRIVQVVETQDVKNYYLTPISKKSISISNIDLISGEVSLSASDVSSNKGGLSLTRIYNSNDDKNKSAGTFVNNYESRVDKKLPENIKSNHYATAELSCTEGWNDIDDKAYLGKLENTQAIYNHVTSLCDIYDDGELLASLITKHKRSGKSNHLHSLSRPNGSTYLFFKKNNTWRTISKTPLKLTESEVGFKITNLNDGVETYNKNGKLLSITNQGQVTTLAYNSREQLESITDPFGESIQLHYEDNLLTETTSYDGTKVKYSYNNEKQLTKVTYTDDSTKSYGYDSNGNLESISDTNGLITKTITYDADGKAISTAGINGINKTELTYSDSKTVIKATTGVTDYHFRVLNSRLLTTKRVTDEGISTTEYDSHGYPKRSTNKFGVLTRTTYDEDGLLVTQTSDADTADEKITFTAYATNFRKPTKIVKDGVVTFYDYDTNGKMIKKTVGSVIIPNQKVSAKEMNRYSKAMLKSDGGIKTQVSSYAYNERGQRTRTIQPNGAVTSNEYDADGNQIKSTNALGYTTETLEFDKAGRPLKTKDYNGKISSTTYDSMGKVLTSTRDGKTTTNEYDNSGRNIKTTYADGRVEEKKYDQSGNVTESWNNQGDRTKSYYDSNNNLIKTETYKDGELTNQSQTEYDSKNRVVANIDAQGNRTTYVYNSKGQQIETKDALGRVTKSVYNSKGQLAKTINPDGKATTYTYNADGQKTEVETPNGATFKFAYDSLSRVTAKINPDRGTTVYTYDVSGNIKTEINAKGESKTYSYDIANRKTSTSYNDATLNETYEYDQGENAKGKLTKITDSSGSMEFAYDVNGNLASKTQTIGTKQFTTSYSYDEHDRMTQQTYPSGKVIGYSYDDKGELMSMSIDGVPFISNIKTNDNGL